MRANRGATALLGDATRCDRGDADAGAAKACGRTRILTRGPIGSPMSRRCCSVSSCTRTATAPRTPGKPGTRIRTPFAAAPRPPLQSRNARRAQLAAAAHPRARRTCNESRPTRLLGETPMKDAPQGVARRALRGASTSTTRSASSVMPSSSYITSHLPQRLYTYDRAHVHKHTYAQAHM